MIKLIELIKGTFDITVKKILMIKMSNNMRSPEHTMR